METIPATSATYASFDELFECFRYPAGEAHIALRSDASAESGMVIEARASTFEDLGQLLTADDILRRNGVSARWFVPYFPFARHDRRNHLGDGFELGVALDMVRKLDIIIADPHSDVSGQLPHIGQVGSVECFRNAGVFDAEPIVVIPDAGASKKAYEWASGRVIQATKRRDPSTGRLSGFEVASDDLGGAPCVIVDDICDGGGTFIGLAKELANKNAGPLTLAVTHGLFTKGTDELCGAFARIIAFAYSDNQPNQPNQPKLAGVEYLPFRTLYTEVFNNQGARR